MEDGIPEECIDILDAMLCDGDPSVVADSEVGCV